MSKLMWIAGILFIAAGIALGLMVFVSTASVVGWGVNLQLAVSLLIGGIVSLGLGSIISGLDLSREAQAEASYGAAAVASAAGIPEFGRRSTAQAAQHFAPVETAAVAVAASAETIEVSEPVKETIEALEQARQNIEHAFDPRPRPVDLAETPPAAETEAELAGTVATEAEGEHEAVGSAEPDGVAHEASEAEPVDGETPEEGQLYVVEERLIRARPARILSDGTVEAETAEGWMRFENLEHLDEYLDAMSPTA